MLSKDMKRAEKRPDWVDLVPAERTLLERLVPRRSTLRSDRRPGNRAASASRSPFLIECQGTEPSFNPPPPSAGFSRGVYEQPSEGTAGTSQKLLRCRRT